MRRLQKIKLRITSFSFSQSLQKLLSIPSNKLSCQFNDISINVSKDWMTNIELIRRRSFQLSFTFLDISKYHLPQILLKLILSLIYLSHYLLLILLYFSHYILLLLLINFMLLVFIDNFILYLFLFLSNYRLFSLSLICYGNPSMFI